jgi:hypothetical protein
VDGVRRPVDHGFAYHVAGGPSGEIYGFRCPYARDVAMTRWLDRQPCGSWTMKQERAAWLTTRS